MVTPGFEQKHPAGRILRKPRGNDCSGRTGTDYHEIVGFILQADCPSQTPFRGLCASLVEIAIVYPWAWGL